jgi:hypothetical protein
MQRWPLLQVRNELTLPPGKNSFASTLWGQGGEMTQALYAHMNNKIKNKKIKRNMVPLFVLQLQHARL